MTCIDDTTRVVTAVASKARHRHRAAGCDQPAHIGTYALSARWVKMRTRASIQRLARQSPVRGL